MVLAQILSVHDRSEPPSGPILVTGPDGLTQATLLTQTLHTIWRAPTYFPPQPIADI